MKEKMITPDAIISEMVKLRESGQETEQETTGRKPGLISPSMYCHTRCSA